MQNEYPACKRKFAVCIPSTSPMRQFRTCPPAGLVDFARLTRNQCRTSRGDAMATKTVYLAQTFHWVDGRLEPGEAIQFMRSDRAERAAARMARTATGAAAYSVSVDPAADHWSEPDVIVRYGAAPRAA